MKDVEIEAAVLIALGTAQETKRWPEILPSSDWRDVEALKLNEARDLAARLGRLLDTREGSPPLVTINREDLCELAVFLGDWIDRQKSDREYQAVWKAAAESVEADPRYALIELAMSGFNARWWAAAPLELSKREAQALQAFRGEGSERQRLRKIARVMGWSRPDGKRGSSLAVDTAAFFFCRLTQPLPPYALLSPTASGFPELDAIRAERRAMEPEIPTHTVELWKDLDAYTSDGVADAEPLRRVEGCPLSPSKAIEVLTDAYGFASSEACVQQLSEAKKRYDRLRELLEPHIHLPLVRHRLKLIPIGLERLPARTGV